MQTAEGEEISSDDLALLMQRKEGVTFSFRSPNEISDLAGFLAEVCPSPETAIVGLTELMANAIEHGVLRIGHQTKLHLRHNLSLEDEIRRRLEHPEYANRLAHILVSLEKGNICFTISDPGAGFDWRPFENFSQDRATHPSGRGIAIARSMGFESVEYLGKGNQVVARVRAPAKVGTVNSST